MQTEEMVPANEFCIYHKIEISFIHSLNEYGLIEPVIIDEEFFLPVTQLEKLEKFVLLHFEMGINLEGIETITHLLQRTEAMQQQIIQLTNRLSRYEEE